MLALRRNEAGLGVLEAPGRLSRVSAPLRERAQPATPGDRQDEQRERRRGAGAIRAAVAGGLTLGELVERQGDLPAYLERELQAALNDEVKHGRVTVDQQGRYAIAAGAFTPDTLEALRTLA